MACGDRALRGRRQGTADAAASIVDAVGQQDPGQFGT